MGGGNVTIKQRQASDNKNKNHNGANVALSGEKMSK